MAQQGKVQDRDVLVVGAGLAGLGCALALARAGLRVIVFESENVAGGRAGSIDDPATGDRVDLGPHVLLSEYRNMLQLLQELGTAEHVQWQDGEFITLLDGRHVERMHMRSLPAPFHLLPDILRVPTVSLSDIVSNRRVLWLAMKLHESDVPDLDRMNAREFLLRMGVSERFMNWYWRTLAMTILNVPLEHCSAGALMRFFHQMISHGGYRIGLPSTSLAELVVEPAVSALEAAGGEIRFSSKVETVSGTGFAVDGAELHDGSRWRAPACVVCVSPQQLSALLPRSWVQRFSLFRNASLFRPSPYICTYTWFSEKLSPEKFWARTWSPSNLNYDFYDLSNVRRGWAARPSLIASNVIDSERVQDLGDEEILAGTLREICDYLPQAREARILHARVHRVPMAIPAPVPGFERMRPQTRTPVKGLFLAGDWIGTGMPASMESALCAGNRAAERAAQYLGHSLRVALKVAPPEGLAGFVNRWSTRHHTIQRRPQ